MASQLEAHEMPLHKVFSSDYDFTIPDYQRAYAWGTEHALQLLDDLDDALERSPEDPYFLGSLVLIKSGSDAASEVVDGQQRLTTLTILLAVLRDLAESAGLRATIEEMIEQRGNELLDLDAKPRLKLRARDAEFFQTWVQTTGSIDGLRALKIDHGDLSNDPRRSIKANATALHDKLAAWSDDKRKQLLQLLAKRTFLVVVTTPDLSSAHRIFSVMNARGLDLSPADIFKANVVGNVDQSGGDRALYSQKWEEAEESLGRQEFADLFLHLRMIYAKVRAKRELLKEFPEQVLAKYEGALAATFIDDVLLPYTKAYAQIEEETYAAVEGSAEVNAWFRRLRQLDNNDWRPPALWALKHHGDDPQWLDQFFRSLERLAASSLLRREYNTPRVTRYASLLTELERGDGLTSASLDLTAEEREATRDGLAGELYLASRVRKYVLMRLDELLANAPGATYDQRIITVEHVLPQNPAHDSPWRTLFTDDERKYWVHRIANLVLLNRAKNAEAGRLPFDLKKERYFNSKKGIAAIALTMQVMHQDSWTPQLLQARQAALIKTLADAWALGPVCGGAQPTGAAPGSDTAAPATREPSPDGPEGGGPVSGPAATGTEPEGADEPVEKNPRPINVPKVDFLTTVLASVKDRFLDARFTEVTMHPRGSYASAWLPPECGLMAAGGHFQIKVTEHDAKCSVVLHRFPTRSENAAALDILREKYEAVIVERLPVAVDEWTSGQGDALRAMARSILPGGGYRNGDAAATAAWAEALGLGWLELLRTDPIADLSAEVALRGGSNP